MIMIKKKSQLMIFYIQLQVAPYLNVTRKASHLMK